MSMQLGGVILVFMARVLTLEAMTLQEWGEISLTKLCYETIARHAQLKCNCTCTCHL